MNAYKDLGKQIRKFRKKKGMTQESLAFEAELHYTFIGHIERGNKLPSLTALANIANALDVKPWVLLREQK